jgi:hypothetical protein
VALIDKKYRDGDANQHNMKNNKIKLMKLVRNCGGPAKCKRMENS